MEYLPIAQFTHVPGPVAPYAVEYRPVPQPPDGNADDEQYKEDLDRALTDIKTLGAGAGWPGFRVVPHASPMPLLLVEPLRV
jgi:hypothetical protein